MHQGEQAYSPAQTQARAHHSPSTAPLPAHPQSYPPHQHHAAPATTELPPISTALYSRDTTASKYYDPTSDHGDHAVARDTARFDNHYPPQVRPHPSTHPLPAVLSITTLFICRDAELTLNFTRTGSRTPIQTRGQHTAPTRSPITRPSRPPTRISRRCSARSRSTNTRAAWKPCLTRPSRRRSTRRCIGEPSSRRQRITHGGPR